MRGSATYQEPTHTLGARVRRSTFHTLKEFAHQQGQPYARLVADAVELYLAERVEGHEPAISAPGVTQLGLELEEPAA